MIGSTIPAHLTVLAAGAALVAVGACLQGRAEANDYSSLASALTFAGVVVVGLLLLILSGVHLLYHYVGVAHGG